MAFTELCCRSGGSNLNAGTRTGNSTVPASGASPLTYASGTWVQSTGVFTVPVGRDPVADGVVAGDFASVYPDAATVTPFVGRVTTRTITTITVSLTAKMGTAPVDGITNTTLKIGGAWKGPNAASGFPFNVIQNTLTNAAGDFPRVNFMNDATYSITAAMTHTLAGPVVFQGFTAAYNDLGKATVDGGTSGASYILLAMSGSGSNGTLVDFIFQNNGATGNARGVTLTGALRVVVTAVRGTGMRCDGNAAYIECEVYAINQSNSSGNSGAGYHLNTGGASFTNCIAHDNAQVNGSGFNGNPNTSGVTLINCIADTNGLHGYDFNGNPCQITMNGCEAYNNGGSGVALTANIVFLQARNCNFVKNTAYGVNGTGATASGFLFNCGFGSGTQANGLGTTLAIGSIQEINSVTYASNITPWVDPANGDFRIVPGRGAVNVGRGAFTETATSYAGTVGYPVIGAAPPLNQQSPPGGQGTI